MSVGSRRQKQGEVENYRAFLLRCWQEASVSLGAEAPWRFTLVQVGSEERKMGFACLEDLFRYLKAELEIEQK